MRSLLISAGTAAGDEQLQWDHCTRPKPKTQPAGEQLSIERGKESQRGLAKQYGAAESGCISSGLQWGQQCCSRCQDTTSGTHQRCLKHSLVALQCSGRLRCIFLTLLPVNSASANVALAHKFMLWQACPIITVSTEPEPCCRPSLVHNIMGSVEWRGLTRAKVSSAVSSSFVGACSSQAAGDVLSQTRCCL